MTPNDEILRLLPRDQIDRVMNQPMCDIAPEFMGFMDQYKALAAIIPKHFTVIDLGCAYNPQCFFFTEHKQYVAVDASECKKFKAPNCRIHTMTIAAFIEQHIKEFDLDETFAICSYVPNWHGHNVQEVGRWFKNLFTFYPSNKQEQREMFQRMAAAVER